MKKVSLVVLALCLFSQVAAAGTAFLTGEQETGMTKQCFYDYLGSTYTITIKSYQLCPLTIKV